MKADMQRRLAVTSRIIAGAVGGYALTSLIAIALLLVLQRLGMAKDEALLAPTLGSFVIYAVIVMTVFHARSATRAWLGLIGVSVPIALLVAILMQAGGGA